jgi:hypothetical protein
MYSQEVRNKIAVRQYPTHYIHPSLTSVNVIPNETIPHKIHRQHASLALLCTLIRLFLHLLASSKREEKPKENVSAIEQRNSSKRG